VGELAASAPVILIVEAGSVSSLNGLAARIADGRIEVVYRHGAFMPLVMALVARHSCTHPVEGPVADLRGPNFGEALRHELNNPLTGILGNAELLLAQRDKLPPGATDRLKTIADLAVHLRETVRRLSNAWEEHAARAREVEVQR
jgi:signal transduction histidine kinase